MQQLNLKTVKPSRRSFLLGAAAVAVAGGRTGWPISASIPIGLQLYSVSEDLQKSVPDTLRALRAIGYTRVETSGFYGLTAQLFSDQLKAAGLSCHSAHLQFGVADPGPLFEQAHALGAHYVVSSAQFANKTAEADPKLEDYAAMADHLNMLGRQAKQAGLQYAYHNHNFEFRKLEGDQIGFDVLLAKTDPAVVAFELDCGWAVAAGATPADYFRRYPERFRMLHVKDFKPTQGPSISLAQDKRPQGTELGRGHIDYRPILKAAIAAGIDEFYIEQEPPFVEMSALAAVRVDYDALRALKLSAG